MRKDAMRVDRALRLATKSLRVAECTERRFRAALG